MQFGGKTEPVSLIERAVVRVLEDSPGIERIGIMLRLELAFDSNKLAETMRSMICHGRMIEQFEVDEHPRCYLPHQNRPPGRKADVRESKIEDGGTAAQTYQPPAKPSIHHGNFPKIKPPAKLPKSPRAAAPTAKKTRNIKIERRNARIKQLTDRLTNLRQEFTRIENQGIREIRTIDESIISTVDDPASVKRYQSRRQIAAAVCSRRSMTV
jgi:hypothetical protein